VSARASGKVRARAQRRNGRLYVATVICPKRCAVRLTVSGAGRTLRRSLSAQGATALGIAPRHGRLRVRVSVDGRLLASGWTRAR
jgi:hypothetical protein